MGDMNALKITQIALLASALLIGLLNPVYNGLTILALLFAAAAGYIGYRYRGIPAAAETAA